ncbi:unnamed protein product [Arabidopsis halleri]
MQKLSKKEKRERKKERETVSVTPGCKLTPGCEERDNFLLFLLPLTPVKMLHCGCPKKKWFGFWYVNKPKQI